MGWPGVGQASRFFVSMESAGDADELTRSDLDGLVRRRFSQSLFFSGTHLLTEESNSLEILFRGRADTDFARLVDERSRDPREREAIGFELQMAYLRYAPTDSISLRAGRLFVLGPLPAVDLDGLALQINGFHGWSGQVGLGREVRYGQSRVDGGAFDALGPRWSYFDDPREETTWLTQADLGWSGGPVTARGGHRVGWRHGDRVSQLTSLVGRLVLGGWDGTLRGTFNHLMERPDRLEARVTIPLDVLSTRLRLGYSYLRPWFDGDSIFNVFPMSPHVCWQAGAETRLSQRTELWVGGHQRVYALQEEIPWLGGLDPAADTYSSGGEFNLYAQLLPVLHVRGTFSGETGYGGTLLSTEAAASWQVVPQRLELGARLRHFYLSDPDFSGTREHQGAARLRGAFRLSSFGDLAVTLEGVSNFRTTVAFRAMALATFDLGPF
ncbi:MAG: hypothetical protein JW797_11130 [Bradymonadales bacterium]|nr:hypothetical protein [Bradymonadales bacterium]